MKLSQNFFNENEKYITPSQIIEFLYCKRFAYFMNCLGIMQNEEKRFKVQVGREIHNKREKQNRNYLRKKINSLNKEINVNLVSTKLGIRGKVDEVHTLKDGRIVPLDYKFAKYEQKLYNTYKTQLVLYSLMIEDVYDTICDKGYIVYCRNGNKLIEILITEKDKKYSLKTLKSYKKVVKGFFPAATKYKSRCIDCCYKNICIK